MQTLVSIIIPTFNRVDLIGDTLESVLSQTHFNWECIVVDDGSNDYTAELLEFYQERDERIKYYKRPQSRPKGANSCRNLGFELSKGEYIQWLDSDDLISKNKIKEQVEVLEKNDAELATCKWGKLLKIKDYRLYEDLDSYRNFHSSLAFLDSISLDHGYFPIHAYLIHRNLIIKSGRWLNSLKVNQDGEFMIRVITNCQYIYFVGLAHVYYRKEEHLKSTSQIDIVLFSHLVESWKLIEQHLKKSFPNSDLHYIKNIKKRIYIRYRDSRGLIKPHYAFFEEAIKEEPSDLKLNFYRLVTRRRWSTILLRFYKNLIKGKISIER